MSAACGAGSHPNMQCLFHEATWTCTYIISDPETKKCAIIDSVMDFDMPSGRTGTEHNDKVIKYVTDNGLTPEWILETHVHADHLTGAAGLKDRYPDATTAIGENVRVVQSTFADIFHLPDFPCDGSQFDHLFTDGEEFKLGNMDCRVMHTPGHTPACVTYVIGKYVVCGDTLFAPDFGTARCDFPKGSASQLYESITGKIFTLPDDCVVLVGHDYQPGGRELQYAFSMKEEKESNKHLAGSNKDRFVAWRTERDGTLSVPKLILPSLQVNLRNGRLPEPEASGTSYLKIPLNVL